MAAVDNFPLVPYDASNPFTRAFAITPDDTNELPTVTRALMVNVGGDVVVQFRDDADPVVLTLQGGVVYPFRVRKVYSSYLFPGDTTATTTTATGIVGFE